MNKPATRLAHSFTPANYKIVLDFTNSKQRQFSGEATVVGTLNSASQSISLHSKELKIYKITINDKPASFNQAPTGDELVISTSEQLTAGEHIIKISYSAAITDQMHGIYPCYYKFEGQDKELFATQFESHHAREVFPCVDEPEAKATFDLTIKTQAGLTVLGNMPATDQTVDGNIETTTFDTTPKMSTYLVAFAFGDLGFTETTNANGVKIRAYATLDKVEQTKFALEHAAKTLEFYDEYFKIAYPLTKCDMIALPDFSSGAMENWGLITYRESCMLVDPKNTATDTKQYVATVVSHELAHQWFGNLVTMKWWDDLWLNESFANWMEYVVVDHFYPEWQVWEQFGATEQQIAFTRDGLASVQAVHQPVNDPEEIRSLFDGAIVYAKGACLIRMLHEYLGAEVFRDGLRIYMERHKYGNTATSDLWQALSEASGKDVGSFMNAWVSQPGHPVLKLDCQGAEAKLEQKRFYANPAQAPKNDQTLWPLPLLNDAFASTELLTESSASVAKKPNTLCLANKGGTGFYHVQYDESELASLTQAIENNELQAVDRQRLLLDSISLSRAGTEKTANMLKLMAAYKNETNYSVWMAISAAIGSLKVLIDNDQAIKPHLQRYIAKLMQQQYSRLGWEPKGGESYFDELLRPLLVGGMIYAEDSQAIKKALDLFDQAATPEDLPADLRSIIYTAAVRELGEPAFDQLFNWYLETTSAEERINICAGLTASHDPQQISRMLDILTTKKVKLQDTGYWFVYLIRNPYARDQAWQWMEQNWSWIKANFAADMHYTDFPRYSASGLCTRGHLKQYIDFFTPKLNEVALTRTIHQGQEDIEARMLWRERDLSEITEFLEQSK